METDFSLKSAALDALHSFVNMVSDLVPRLLTAIIVILLGWIIAKLLEKGLGTLLTRLKMDAFLERIGLTDLLKRIGIRGSPTRILARTIYLLVLILFIQSATESVGLTAVSGAISAFFGYLPNIIAAFVVFLLGGLIAGFASRMVTESAKESGIDYAPSLGRMVGALIFFVVAIMAITQLKIETEIVRSIAIVLLAGGALGFALTFGLGTREVTRNIVAGFYARKQFSPGAEIEISGEKGVLVSITPVQTLLEKGEKVIAIPNKVFLEEVVKQ
jgi:uncharacterized integral membrane protein